MNSTGSIDNPKADMSAMHFCRAWSWRGFDPFLKRAVSSFQICGAGGARGSAQKERPRSRGERSPRKQVRNLLGGNAAEQGREEKTPL